MTMIAAPFNGDTVNTFPDFAIRDKLGNGVIALDAEKKQLLFLTKKPETASCVVINLNNLNAFSVTKEYSSIKAGDLKRNKLRTFLKNIFFNLRSDNGPVTLSVYNAQQDANADVRLLESKAKKWQNLVSKFLKSKGYRTKV
jgi:endonuclease/exonuclease/phosphatase (EEP) superfamily protein YafD